MIDHVSIPVSKLSEATGFYKSVLSELGLELLVSRETTVGFGKKYPEFWLSERVGHSSDRVSDGFHVCLRAASIEQVNAFHEMALACGGKSNGKPGIRKQYSSSYYAAFIQDFYGNCIEAVTFVS